MPGLRFCMRNFRGLEFEPLLGYPQRDTLTNFPYSEYPQGVVLLRIISGALSDEALGSSTHDLRPTTCA